MAIVGVSITKATAFRGATQEFSNVYHYKMPGYPSNIEAAQLIDNLATYEKTFHSTAVTFVRGRLWKETGNKLTSEMIEQHNLSGTGARATLTNLDPERALLFRVRAGIDSRGNPVYLRKWYHTVGQMSTAVTISTGHLAQFQSFTSAERANLVNAMTLVSSANNSLNVTNICSKSGRDPDPLAVWDAHRWLEHHQLGDQWRAQ